MQTPQNKFNENAAAFKENSSFPPTHSSGISNEDLEHQSEDEWICPG